jgi:hypothetical protein
MRRRRRNRSKRIERDLLRDIDQAEHQHGDRHGRDRAMKYRHCRSLSQVLPQDDNREREESAKPAAHYLAQRIRARHSVNSEISVQLPWQLNVYRTLTYRTERRFAVVFKTTLLDRVGRLALLCGSVKDWVAAAGTRGHRRWSGHSCVSARNSIIAPAGITSVAWCIGIRVDYGFLGNFADGARALPGVALFAAKGIWNRYYVFLLLLIRKTAESRA